jgi:dynein heavy chain
MIIEFFDKKEIKKLIFYVDSKESLVPTLDFPHGLKKKAIYFLKSEEMQVTKENVKLLQRGDLSAAPIDQLSALVEGLFLPLLSSSANNVSWPKVVSDDVITHAQHLRSVAHVVSGQMKGQTLLPLPAGMDGLDDSVVNKAVVHQIESAVIEWAHQVRDVLKKDSAQPLIEGLNPGALVELDFWAAKKANLTCISEQLHAENMLHMQQILEDYNSSYAGALRKLYQDVTDALEESTDVSRHLETLRKFLEDIEEGEFSNFPITFLQLMKILTLIWGHSKFYNVPRNMVVILREIFNQLIGAVSSFVDRVSLSRSSDSLSPLPSSSWSPARRWRRSAHRLLCARRSARSSTACATRSTRSRAGSPGSLRPTSFSHASLSTSSALRC